MCTVAEIKFYFSSFLQGGSKKSNYLKPNRNCNLTSWVPGCEPGWACSVGKGKKVDLKNSKDEPERTLDCQTCCEGFFCPHGITCMIRKYLKAKNFCAMIIVVLGNTFTLLIMPAHPLNTNAHNSLPLYCVIINFQV